LPGRGAPQAVRLACDEFPARKFTFSTPSV
jgi:hypothetical protein